MRKTVLLILILITSITGFVSFAHARNISETNVTRDMLQRLEPLGEYVYNVDEYTDGRANLFSRITNIISIALGFVGLIAVILVIYGGFMYMTARGNDDQVSDARQTIYRAMVGLIIIIFSYAITVFVTNVAVNVFID